METGYVLGGLACLIYAAWVFYIAYKKPKLMFSVVKKKLFNASDKTATIVCYVFSVIALAAAILLFTLGSINS